jgi:preprotein translocase subunit YajC
MRTFLATILMILAATPAFAQATGAPASPSLSSPEGMQAMLLQFGPIVLMIGLFYVLMIRPQQRRAKEHAARLAAVKRGDTVVMSSGMIGKVVRVEDTEVGVEIAQGVTVKVVKSMISDIRTKGEPAPANDARS